MPDPPHNLETQVVGELDRRLAEEAEAILEVAEMTLAEMDEAGLRPGPVADLRAAAKAQSGRRRPRAEDHAEAAEDLTDDQRQAVVEALATPSAEEPKP